MSFIPMDCQIELTHELLERLVEKDETDINKVIRGLPPAKPTTVPSRPSDSFGSLAFLPTEILMAVASHLDIQTLTRLTQVSMALKDVVEFNPVYRDLMTHAPEALAALAATGLLGIHPAPTLHHALSSWRCSSCTVYFGAYLFLPTAERACLSCLDQNPALRVYEPQAVQESFALSDAQFARLPLMRIIQGDYKCGRYADARAGKLMVAVGAARKLSTAVYDASQCEQMMRRPGGAHLTTVLRTMLDAPLEPPGHDLTLQPRPRYHIDDYLSGVAVVRMPYMSSPHQPGAELDRGRLCRGCLVTQTHYRSGTLPGGVAAAMWPPDLVDGGQRAMEALTSRLWTREGFAEHAKECYGARLLLEQWGAM